MRPRVRAIPGRPHRSCGPEFLRNQSLAGNLACLQTIQYLKTDGAPIVMRITITPAVVNRVACSAIQLGTATLSWASLWPLAQAQTRYLVLRPSHYSDRPNSDRPRLWQSRLPAHELAQSLPRARSPRSLRAHPGC